MRIVLSGVETNNKGAELMLYAILHEIEKKDTSAEVYISESMIRQGTEYVNTSVSLRLIPTKRLAHFFQRTKITSILNHLGLFSAWFNNLVIVKGADFFIDGSGLLFSDSRINSTSVSRYWKTLLRRYKRTGTKIVFLPQAFGPFLKKESISCVKALLENADLVFARDKQSFDYLLPFSRQTSQIFLYPDFTALVQGVIPQGYSHLKGAVCFILNVKMIKLSSIEDYLGHIHTMIQIVKDEGFRVYLLNHEGEDDQKLLNSYQSCFDKSIEIVGGLNAVEVKGVLSTAYLVISSRFHGVVSSLNSGVPCLSTSWHHKYAELYNDYGLANGVLPINNMEACKQVILDYLKPEVNSLLRDKIRLSCERIKKKNHEMWQVIWN